MDNCLIKYDFTLRIFSQIWHNHPISELKADEIISFPLISTIQGIYSLLNSNRGFTIKSKLILRNKQCHISQLIE